MGLVSKYREVSAFDKARLSRIERGRLRRAPREWWLGRNRSVCPPLKHVLGNVRR